MTLEKKILERMIELIPVSDKSTAAKMLERSGVKFIMAGGKTGVYQAGMLRMDGSPGVQNFNVADIQGFLMADAGNLGEDGLAVDQASLIQDLQNQILDKGLEIGKQAEIIAAKDELLLAADNTIREMSEAVDTASDVLDAVDDLDVERAENVHTTAEKMDDGGAGVSSEPETEKPAE